MKKLLSVLCLFAFGGLNVFAKYINPPIIDHYHPLTDEVVSAGCKITDEVVSAGCKITDEVVNTGCKKLYGEDFEYLSCGNVESIQHSQFTTMPVSPQAGCYKKGTDKYIECKKQQSKIQSL